VFGVISEYFSSSTIFYLFESLQYFLPLSKMSEEKLECSRHKGWIIMHAQMKKHTEKSFTPCAIQVKDSAVLTATKQTFLAQKAFTENKCKI
jgi:hypothetical protein